MFYAENFMKLETREDVLKLFKNLVNPLIPLYTEEKAGLHIGNTGACYETKTIPMEGFSRVLWGLVPFWLGNNDGLEEFQEIYKQGILAGTNPENKEYWGGFRDYDQLFVEMASISCLLIFTPEKIWDTLSDIEKDRVANWLYQMNNYIYPENNWQLFNVLVNVALKKVGKKYDKDQLEGALQKVESYYQGDGWYTDGHKPHTDYYISFGIHFYCLVYAVAMEKEDEKRSKLFKDRAEQFAKQFIYWFSEDGSAIPFGRSLTYRFAQCAFWGVCAFAGIEPFSYGVIKGIILRHLDEWFKNPILDRDGVLTIGYKYPNLHMAEAYNAPGSPYWSFKAFIILALPQNHPFWTTKTEPLPKLDNIKTLDCAKMIITRKNNNVCAYVVGEYEKNFQEHMNEKYSKFVYSTIFGFSVSITNMSLHESAPDSMLAFVIDGMVFVRRNSQSYKIKDNTIYSKWSPFIGITVETIIMPNENGHIRKHIIKSEMYCKAYDCGFAVALEKENAKFELLENGAVVQNIYSKCIVKSKDGKGDIIMANANTNLMAQKTAIPTIEYEITQGVSEYVTEVII